VMYRFIGGTIEQRGIWAGRSTVVEIYLCVWYLYLLFVKEIKSKMEFYQFCSTYLSKWVYPLMDT
ncbi:hypothetical protein, partial [Salmonella sp. hn-h2]|uniref:hypothetical protein n=1 Tax=Salmonella sp. hn-h2 TaxID=2582611 RepID=UPI001F2264B6